MFSENDLMEIGERECKSMFSEDFINKYRRNGGFTYGLDDTGNVNWCALGISTDDYEDKIEYRMGGETPDEFVAFVNIDPETGEVTRDYKNSRLPE